MKIFLVCFITLGSFMPQFTNAQMQCAVDVQIVEGNAITMCETNPQTISGTDGFVNYAWSGPENQVSQTITQTFQDSTFLAHWTEQAAYQQILSM